MKNLVTLLALLSLISCSSDDSPPELASIHTGYYDSPEHEITYYRNGLPVKINHYVGDIRGARTLYTYNEKDIISSIAYYNHDGEEESRRTFTYDAQDRLITITQAGAYNVTTSFEYGDGLVTETKSSINFPSNIVRTYYVNTDGLVYRYVSDTETFDAEYEGTSVISLSGPDSVTAYRYYETYDRNLLGLKNIGGPYLPNTIFIFGFKDGLDHLTTKYLKKKGYSEYEYIFRSDGRPGRMSGGWQVLQFNYN